MNNIHSLFVAESILLPNKKKRTKCVLITCGRRSAGLAVTSHVNYLEISGVHRNFVRGGRGSTNSVEDRGQRERGSGGDSPLVRDSGVRCNLVQEISFLIVKFS